MTSLRITWRLRVLAALLLAFLFRSSDAAAPWSTPIPDLMAATALAAAAVMLVLESRGRRVRAQTSRR